MEYPGRAAGRLFRLSLRLGLLTLLAGTLSCSTAWLRWEDQTRTYTVRPGDTLYQIAFKHQLDYRDIAWWNGIGRHDVIHPGQELRLTAPLPGVLRPPPEVPAGQAARRPSADKPSAARPADTAAVKAPSDRPTRPAPATPSGKTTAWQWPVRGSILAQFDPNRGRKGIDIGGAEGVPIKAAAAGKVVYAGGALKGYGELVIIKHDEEFLSAYGHNQRLLVKEGAMVKAGEPIAQMGLGPQNRPLLHFEIRRLGKPVNPEQLLPG